MHHVFLIPGFFGFSNLGDVKYFRAVRETIERQFLQRNEPVVVTGVKTRPTGSLRQRARSVVAAIREMKSIDVADHIHLVGHSTGGIDARLVASNTRELGFNEIRDRVHDKLRTVVCLSTPHYGTPLANFFTTIYGKKLLYFITLLVFVGLWRRPVAFAGGMLGLGFKFYDLLGLNESLLHQLTNQLLRDFTPAREREVREFLNSILDDVSLMIQLTPESMDVLHATLQPLERTRYVSYATVSPPPGLSLQRASLRQLITPLSTVLYSTLYALTARPQPGYAYHPATDAKWLVSGLRVPFEIDASSNDGVVPTLSQIFGEFRGFVNADHLDIVGHYLRGPLEKRDGADWFMSGANFNVEQFDTLWSDVCDVMLAKR